MFFFTHSYYGLLSHQDVINAITLQHCKNSGWKWSREILE